jgi:hypothetical protein
MTISDNPRDYGKFTDGATHDPEKGAPGLFAEVAMALGVCINPGGEYFEGDKAHSVAGMSERIIKKKIVP